VVGASGVGKTAIVERLTSNEFSLQDGPTVGSQLFSHTIGNIELSIWDTAGQERFRGLSQLFFRCSAAALLVFSVDNRASFEAIDSWRNDVKEVSGPNVVLFLVGNRSDLETGRTVTEVEARAYARRHGMEYVETSAMTGSGIQEAFEQLAQQLGGQLAADMTQPQ
jgi:small GTP-binding protein